MAMLSSVYSREELRAAILPTPEVVAPEASLQDALDRLIRPARQEHAAEEFRAGCVLIADASQLLGILTRQDMLCLYAQAHALQTPVRTAMTAPVITLSETELIDFETVDRHLRQHQIRHLPIVDSQGQIIGIITRESLDSCWRRATSPAVPTQATLEGGDQQENTALFRTIFEQAAVGIAHVSLTGALIRLNQRFCDIVGHSHHDLSQRGFQDITYPDDLQIDLAHMQKLLAGECQTYQLEKRYITADGDVVWAHLTVSLIRDRHGAPDYFIAVIEDISARKAAEHDLKVQRDFNQLIAELTSRFVDLAPADLDAEIDRSLRLIGEATQADTSYLLHLSASDAPDANAAPHFGGRTLSMTHEWSRAGCPRQIALVQAVPMAAFPWSMGFNLKRQVLCVPSVADLPPEAAVDQAGWRHFNLTSVLSVPLIQRSTITGILGFASFGAPVQWSEETIRLLQVMGQTIANVQERIQAEHRLYVSEERLRLALAVTQQGLYDLNPQTGAVIVSREYATMLGYDPETFVETADQWMERLHPDDRDRTINHYQDYITGKIAHYRLEFRLRTRTGDYIWILSLGKIVAWDAAGNPIRMLGTHTDITDRKQAEAERQQTAQIQLELTLLENILDDILAGYWDWDIPHHQEYLSPGLKRMFGYADDELPNTPESWQQIIFPEDLPGVLNCFERHVQSRGKVPYYNEVRYRHKDGSTIWVICSGKVIEWDEAGNPLRMIGCHVDITERKRAEDRLRKQDAHLKTAQRIGKLGSWELSIKTGEVNWSDEVFRIFGRDSAAGAPSLDAIQQTLHRDDRDYYQQTLLTAIETAQPYDLECRLYRPDGTLVYIQARGEPIFDRTGQLTQMVGTILDITDRKQTEERLQLLSDRLSLALEAGAIATWDWDFIQEVSWDRRMYDMYGLAHLNRPIRYQDWLERLHPDDRTATEAALQAAIDGTSDYDVEFRIWRTDGALRWIKATAVVQRNEQGHPLRMTGINYDITERKQAEEKLLQTTAQLKASNQELEAFAYSVSHDLRAPLRAIDGFSKALLEDYGDQFDADGQDYFERIRRNVQRMGTLIDDLLRLSRVSRSEMQYSAVNLSALVLEQLHELQQTEPNRQVESVVTPNLIVSADATLMRVALNNLVQNAWKFTSQRPTACIEFGVRQRGEQPIYFIRDNGVGFDMAYAAMLFGVFQRLHNSDEFPGTGIGLATVQRAIHRHGGQVWAESAIAQGAIFYFTVPHTHSSSGA